MKHLPHIGTALQFPSPYDLDNLVATVPASPEEELALEGLIAIGGDLSLERLVLAYSMGIFPWYSEDEPLAWWSPSPRPVIEPGAIHVSKSLAKFYRNHPYKITSDKAFAAVIEECSQHRDEGTWLTPEMKQAYIKLFEIGYAHSIEVWDGNTLVGGLYGVAIGQGFFGESMFTRVNNASKLALIALCEHLHRNNYQFLDGQQPSPHLEQFGAKSLPRREFLDLLKVCQVNEGHPGPWGKFIHRPRN